MNRTASAVWRGTLKEGQGELSTESKTLNASPYSFKARFEDGSGTNPDELLAAAHAGCFAMALSKMLEEAGFPAEMLEVKATIDFDLNSLSLKSSHLSLRATVPGIEEGLFLEHAENAKANCPVSKALSLDIRLDAALM